MEIDGSNSLDMRDYKIEPLRVLMLDVQPETSIRTVISAVRVD